MIIKSNNERRKKTIKYLKFEIYEENEKEKTFI